MRGDIYALRGDTPVLLEGLLTIVMQGNTTELVRKEKVKKGVHIYLYFTGIDLAEALNEKPLLFEVSVCGGKFHKERELYSTLAEAELGYRKFFSMAKNETIA